MPMHCKLRLFSFFALLSSFFFYLDAGEATSSEVNRKVDAVLATDPDAKSLKGLYGKLAGDTEVMEYTAQISAESFRKWLLVSPDGLPTKQFVIARLREEKKIGVNDVRWATLTVLSRSSTKDVYLGLLNPSLLYWQFEEDWKEPASWLPDASKDMKGTYALLTFTKGIPKEAFPELLNENLLDALPRQVAAGILDRGIIAKFIDPKDPIVQNQLEKMKDDMESGTSLYLRHSSTKGVEYEETVKKFITKIAADQKKFAVFIATANPEMLHNIDVLALDIPDSAKTSLLQFAHGK
jgi:hypothetical protein